MYRWSSGRARLRRGDAHSVPAGPRPPWTTCTLSCEDPLTGLSSLAHLRSRLGELYREAELRGPVRAATHWWWSSCSERRGCRRRSTASSGWSTSRSACGSSSAAVRPGPRRLTPRGGARRPRAEPAGVVGRPDHAVAAGHRRPQLARIWIEGLPTPTPSPRRGCSTNSPAPRTASGRQQGGARTQDRRRCLHGGDAPSPIAWPARLIGMCGRYASSRVPRTSSRSSRSTDVRGRGARSSPTTTSRRPRRCTPWSSGRPRRATRTRRAERQLRVLQLGAGAVLGQGPLDRQPDDQRADGDGRGEAGLPQGVRHAALPAAGRRLLRVVRHRAEGRRPASRSSSRSSSTRRTGRAGDGRALRDLAGPDPRRRRPASASGGPARSSPPRPRTTSAASTTGCRCWSSRERYDAWLDPTRSDPDDLLATCWSRPRPAGSRPTRSRPRSTTCATTAPSCSSRCRRTAATRHERRR